MFKNFLKRTTVILLSFMMAIQVIPFSMYDMSSYAEKERDGKWTFLLKQADDFSVDSETEKKMWTDSDDRLHFGIYMGDILKFFARTDVWHDNDWQQATLTHTDRVKAIKEDDFNSIKNGEMVSQVSLYKKSNPSEVLATFSTTVGYKNPPDKEAYCDSWTYSKSTYTIEVDLPFNVAWYTVKDIFPNGGSGVSGGVLYVSKEYTGNTLNNGISTPNGCTCNGASSGVNAGTYTATYRLNDNCLWADNNGNVRYTNGNVVSNNDFAERKVVLTINPTTGKASITGETGLKCNSNPQELIAKVGSTGATKLRVSGPDDRDFGPWKDSASDIKGTKAGTYTIQYYLPATANYTGDGSSSSPYETTVKIEKGDGKATLEKADLTYTGEPQKLISSDSTTGTAHYRVSNADGDVFGNWTTDVNSIVGTTAGAYRIQYYVDENEDYTEYGSEAEPKEMSVNIKKAEASLSLDGETGLKYNGSSQSLIKKVNQVGDGTIFYSMTGANNNIFGGWTTNIDDIKVTNAGTYKIKYYSATSTNYFAVGSDDMPAGTIEVTVDKIEPELIVREKTGLVFNSMEQNLLEDASVTGNGTMHFCVSAKDSTTQYSEWTTNLEDIKGAQAGTYRIKYFADTSTNYLAVGNADYPARYIDVVIAKADAEKTDPVAKTGLQYNRSEQELVQSGSSEYGTYWYYMSTSDNIPSDDATGWTTDIPKGKEVGTYYVWYKFISDDNHNSVDVTSLGGVSISKRTVKIIATDKNTTYGQDVPTWEYTTTNLLTGDSFEGITFVIKDEDGNVVSPSTETSAGSYTINIEGASNPNYNISTERGTWTIEKATAEKTDPQIKSTLTYNDENQVLVEAGTSSHGTYYYYYTTSNNMPDEGADGWSANVPVEKKAGKYYVWYQFVGDINHISGEITCAGNITINQVDATFETNPTAKTEEFTYDGDEHVLFDAGTAKYSDTKVEYAVGLSDTESPENNWSEEIPAVTNAGTYYLWARIKSTNESVNAKSAYCTGVSKVIGKAQNTITAPENQEWDATYSKESQTYTLTGFSDYQGELTYSVEEVKKDSSSGTSVKDSEYFNMAGSSLNMNGETPIGTYIVTVKGAAAESSNYNAGSATFEVKVTVSDKTRPTASFTSTNDLAASQTITLEGSDNVGITKYYFGPDASGEPDTDWTEGITKTIDTEGTNYFITKDAAGHKSEPVKITFYKTKLVVPEGTSVSVDTILTAAGYKFELPILSGIPTGYREVLKDTWQVGDTGQTVDKGKEYAPEGNYTLTARIEATPLTFVDQEASFEGSANSQYMPIKEASGGTGNYVYTIKSQPAGDYFSLSEDKKKLVILPELPAGVFSVRLHVYDEVSHASAEADYIVEMVKNVADIEFDTEELNLTYPQTGTINITNNVSGGDVTVVSKDKNIATAEMSEDQKSIIVKSGVKEGTAILHIAVASTPAYGSIEKDLKIIVKHGTLNITAISENATANGLPHYAKLKSDVEDVEVRYGKDDNYDCIMTIPSADTLFNLSDVSRTDIGTTIIKYKVSKPGYYDVPGSVTITLTDDQPPTGSITESTQALTDHQTVTLQAQDNDKIVAYYFGTDADHDLINITPTQEFKRERVDVQEGAGIYHFIVKDEKGNKNEVASLEFYNTDFHVEHGSVDFGTILIASGDSFPLPEIHAATGYKSETVKWEVSGDGTEFDQKANYSPKKTAVLNADCIELSAELKYDRNEHGENTPGTKIMWYTLEATAAPAMENIDGWTFTGWNTQSDGKGTYYAGGATVKNKDVIPHEVTLYAIWEKNALVFNNVETTVEVSEDAAQTVDISSAANGTGSYTYSILVQANDYFVIDNDNDKIIVKAGTPGGNHVITVKAEDNETHITALATYTITMKRHAYALVVDSQTESIETTMIPIDTKTFEITNPSGGILSVSSDKTDVARAVITSGTIVITPGGALGTAILTIHVAETDYYEEDTVICTVNVVQQQDAIGEIRDITNYDANKQTVTLYAKHADRVMAVYFGTDENGTPVELKFEDSEIAAVEYTEKREVTNPGKYYLRVRDGNGNTTTVASVNFYLTTFIVKGGGVLYDNSERLTTEGKGFTLPAITATNGFTAPDKWSNGMAPGDFYTPDKTTYLEATCTEGSVPTPEPVINPDTDELELQDTGHNLVVGDSESDLSVNFFFRIPGNYTGGTMKFKIAHSDEEHEVSGYTDLKGVTRYCFKINVNQMSDGITWKYEATNGETCELEEPYCFYDYLNTATVGNYAESYPELAEFCNRLKTYGYYAQNYLASYGGASHFVIGQKYTEIPEPGKEPSENDLSSYVVDVTDPSEDLTSEDVKLSLVLDDLISLKVIVPTTISSDAELPVITVNGIEPDGVSLEGENIIIEIKGISAIRLADKYTITVGDATIKTSAMAYANRLKQDQEEPFAVKLGAALYDLYAAATEYAISRE